MNKPTSFYVEYNACYIAMYKSIRACLNFIKRRGLRDNEDNLLRIWDNTGVIYDPVNGRDITDLNN